MKVEVIKTSKPNRFAGIIDFIDKKRSFSVLYENKTEALRFLKLLEDETDVIWQAGQKPTKFIPSGSKSCVVSYSGVNNRLSFGSSRSAGSDRFNAKDII